MITSVRLPLSFDVSGVKREVEELAPAAWLPHFNTRYYEGDWSGVALRGPAGGHLALYPDPTADAYVDTDALGQCPGVSTILAQFECKTESVRFLRLGALAEIREHRDYRLSIEDGLARIHIPVKTSRYVDFFVGGEKIDMNEGEVWYLNFNLPHSVINNGNEERIHLVIDCVANDWLRDMIVRPAKQIGSN